jgi:hypothetical protein
MPFGISNGNGGQVPFSAVAVGQAGPMNECLKLGSGEGGLNDRLWVDPSEPWLRKPGAAILRARVGPLLIDSVRISCADWMVI